MNCIPHPVAPVGLGSLLVLSELAQTVSFTGIDLWTWRYLRCPVVIGKRQLEVAPALVNAGACDEGIA